jgi:nitrite reductase (NADH) small subunit
MSVIKFRPVRGTLITQGSDRYMLSTIKSSYFLLKAKCPHRGGPLHLGNLSCDKLSVICPWHDLEVSINKLQNSAVPMVCRGNAAIAILPQDASIPVEVKQSGFAFAL